jgi:hypothetical protein
MSDNRLGKMIARLGLEARKSENRHKRRGSVVDLHIVQRICEHVIVCCSAEAFFYDLEMKIGRNFFSMFVLGLVAIAVMVNFARTAPFVLSVEGKADAYVDLSLANVEEGNQRRTCPCPTEVEKTDCDEGLCSFGLVSRQLDQLQNAGRFLHAKRLTVWRTIYTEPEPDPPRAAV